MLLLVHPEGRTGEELGFDLYGDDMSPVTVRAELSRLRRILGPELLESRPYRLRAELDADFRTVTRLLERGRVAEALDEYAGPLLPGSDAPGVARLRRLIEGQLRAAVLAAATAHLLRDLAARALGRRRPADVGGLRGPAPARLPGPPAGRRPHPELAAEYGLATSVATCA